ncbi:CDGSH iron-sulfur domain-containing protein [Streptomyces odontomachi]|uniref:CDGSH iron-sulfur domain-containing protein n=1 Tax=Streptomyces odontomachi TaxID=2944940 RepID=UPI00210DD034|nr:CDGSH iron-sulfur domain-containing protein [Streptomyces sp. ODS25]
MPSDPDHATHATHVCHATHATHACHASHVCQVTLGAEGPILLSGPVEVTLEDGTVARSDRFTVAVCTCRRTAIPPWCDTSHRRRRTPHRGPAADEKGTGT